MAKGANFANKAADFIEGALDGPILKSNESINKAFEFMAGKGQKGITGSLRGIGSGKNVLKAIGDAHMKDGKADIAAITGSYIGLGIAGRVATGGGIYRDSSGNVNVPGVPFV